ncbi:MAG: HtaA domain-containing protein [Propionibacteriaceae bacterium]|nr:HtaA domain-containing protein [Propionibacteriaceae bacterium]
MTSHTALRSRPRRALSVGLASALALGALGFIAPTTAHAIPSVATGTISWGLKASFRNYILNGAAHGTITAADPAADDGTQTTFANAGGNWNTAAANITSQGAVNFAGHEGVLDITIANPSIVVDATDAYLVVDATDSQGTEHPDLKVAALDLTDAVTVNGFAVTIDRAPATLTEEGEALFLYNGNPMYSAGDELDPVSASISLVEPKVEVSRTTWLNDDVVAVTVTGSGFLPGDAIAGNRPPLAGKPGGLYIAAGKYREAWRPSEGAPAAARANLKAHNANVLFEDGLRWAVLKDDMATVGGHIAGAAALKPDGTFVVGLTFTKAQLDALGDSSHVNYGIYTYPGGGASNAAWETYTPITFTTAPEPEPEPEPAPVYVTTITQLVTAGDTRYGTAAKATVTVTTKEGAPVGAGSVELSGIGSTLTASVTGGKATFTLPAGATVGTHTLTAIYAGAGLNLASTGTTRLTVSKASVSGKAAVSKKPTSKKTGTATVTLTGASGGTAPGGTAYVKFTKGKSSKTVKVTLTNGQGKLTIPKLKKGTWKVYLKYNGDARYNALTYQKVTSTKVTK